MYLLSFGMNLVYGISLIQRMRIMSYVDGILLCINIL